MSRSRQTKSGVVYDVSYSPFVSQRHGLTFFFSSMSHKEKFDSNVTMKENWLSDSLSRRFKINVDAKVLAAIQLYINVETRGFYIEDSEGNEYKWQDDVIFRGDVSHVQNCTISSSEEMLY